jgi:dipeptidyl aminopeptidase/acylaminoacyl peptidase
VWFLHSRSDHTPIVLDGAGGEVLRSEGPEPPPARSFVSWHFENPHGQRVHGFYVTPEGTGPWPVVMHVHGGPDWLDTDEWKPGVQSYIDHGFAVAMVNYRGSMGYGPAWRDVVIGDIGRPEIEDVNAGLADLIRRGIADPNRAVVGGWSWGGYVTLMELGKHPELWAAGIAGIPVGDYAASYEDLSPLLKAYDRALLGGTPDEVPGLMRDRNPINFVDRVRAPVLFLAGENDSRCPIRQVMLYVERLRERNHPHELYLFATGHGSLDTEEEIRQYRAIHEFLARHLPRD